MLTIPSIGYLKIKLPLDSKWESLVKQENWPLLDQLVRRSFTNPGPLFDLFQSIHPYQYFENIISIRDASDEFEEDGIWHDDGSRLFACSLSLTLHPQELEGGVLGIRKKEGGPIVYVPTPEFATAIIFKTGIDGFEHRIHKVTKGRRIIMAGWFS